MAVSVYAVPVITPYHTGATLQQEGASSVHVRR